MSLRAGPDFTNTVGAARALWRRGVTLSCARHAVERLAAGGAALVMAPRIDDGLAAELAALSVELRPVSRMTAAGLKQVRSRLNMSQHQFADTFGFSHRTLQKWEAVGGELDPSTSLLLKLIEADPDLVAAVAAA